LLTLYNDLTKKTYNEVEAAPDDYKWSDFELTEPKAFAAAGLYVQDENEVSPYDIGSVFHFRMKSASKTKYFTIILGNKSTTITDEHNEKFGYTAWKSDYGYALTKWPGYQVAKEAIVAGKTIYNPYTGKQGGPITLPSLEREVIQQMFEDKSGQSFVLMHELTKIPMYPLGGSYIVLARVTPDEHDDVCYIFEDGNIDEKLFDLNVQHGFRSFDR
jgi:hypothetical protein